MSFGSGNIALNFPSPWASSPSSSYVVIQDDYAQALMETGIEVAAANDSHTYALDYY